MLKYLKKYWFFALLAPIFMSGEVFMDLLQPRLMSTIVDEGVLGLSNDGVGDLNLVITTGLKMIIFVIIGGCCGVLCGVFAHFAAQNFGNDLRKDAFKNIMSFSFEQTDEFSTGSLITRVTNDVTQLQTFLTMLLRGFIRTFLLFSGGIICMITLDLSFGIVIACSLPFILVCVFYFISKANPVFSVLQKKLDHVNNVLQENVSGTRVVKAYVKEDYEKNRFNQANSDLSNTQLNVLLLFSYMTPIMNIILNVSIVAVIKIGSIEVTNGDVTPGVVMAAITYISQVLNAVMRMTMIFQSASRGIASGRRVSEVINCKPAIVDGSYEGIGNTKGKVEFKNVSFAYPGMKDKRILKNINLTINPGETIGILGETGCGKSSLVNLIPRFFDVTEGELLVDGIDVRNYKLSTLRNKISIALQKSEIFTKTISENISLGKKDASFEEITKAASIAQAEEFIVNKPEGYDTLVNVSGMNLSGGQKQRLAISRAIIKESNILIFDDTTSALDLKTEAKLYKALEDNYKDITKIIIAQRITSVKDADRIVIIDNGTIVDIGSHEELLANSSIYRDIYDSQLKGGVANE